MQKAGLLMRRTSHTTLEKIYPFLKVFISAAALVCCVRRGGRLYLTLAMICCIMGDLFLAWSDELHRRKREPFFSLGIGAFAIAHIFLTASFVTDSRPQTPSILLIIALACLVPIGIHMGIFKTGHYTAPVIGYGVILSFMIAWSVGRTAFPGALLFGLSDSLLAFWYFKPKSPYWLGIAALVIYDTSIFLLALS